MNSKYNPEAGSLDDIDDLPGFKCPPTGGYKLRIEDGIVFKADVNNHPAETVNFTILEIMEQADAASITEADQVHVGDKFSIAFLMDNDIGAGFFKEFCKPIAEKFSVRTIPEIRIASKGLEVIAAVEKGKPNSDGRSFPKIKAMGIA